MSVPAILLIVCLGAWGGTAIICALAAKLSLLDIPNERSSHKLPTPRGGGASVVLVFVVTLLYCLTSGKISLLNSELFLLAIILVAGIGFLDDLKGVSSRWRLLCHFIAATLFVLPYMKYFEQNMGLAGLAFWLPSGAVLVSIVGLVWMLNMFNFMDGIDGIAATEAIFICFGGATLLYNAGLYSYLLVFLILGAGSLGFLFLNWPPARIFMGDVCSGFLGFTIGALAIHTTLLAPGMTIWPWLILTGVFLVDTTYTLLIRVFRGRQWYMAHRSHAYQHAVIKYGGHRFVTISVLIINIVWLLPLAFFTIQKPHYGIYLTLIAYLPLVMISRALKAGEDL